MNQLILLLILTVIGCTNTPTRYHQNVRITDSIYRNEIGQIIEDCSWFENYKVRLLYKNVTTCVRIWNMENL